MSAKILVIDIETAPETAYIWKRFKETIGQSQVKEPGYLMCMCWAWAGQPVEGIRLYGSRSWNRGDRHNDWAIIKKAHELLDEADIVVGHNIRSFDMATLNARFVHYELPPPTPYKICDTLEILKRKFKLPSNSLEAASHYFGIDIKEKQPFTLWRDCLEGVPAAWDNMLDYCKHDVKVVEQLYNKLIPWADLHPNMALYEEDGTEITCPKCGSKNLERRGAQRTTTLKYQRFQCKDCGGWSRSRTAMKPSPKVLTHAVVT